MADELTVSINISYINGSRTHEVSAGNLSLDAGNLFFDTIQAIGTSAEAIVTGDITSPGYIFMQNLDSTNYVTIRTGSGGADVIKMAAGDIAFFKLSGTTPFGIANTAACDLRVCVFKA